VSSALNDLPTGMPQALQRLSVPAHYRAGEPIYRCNDRIEHWYQIVSGAARKSALSCDGRRHIVDFILPGEPFGLAAAGFRRFCVEALVPGTLIVRFPRVATERLVDSDPHLSRYIREAAFASIARLQLRMAILGRTSALEKVSAFLLEMEHRSQSSPAQRILLPMSRYDIADYLGMAVETVSRTLTELCRRRVIAFHGLRDVGITDGGALKELADGLSRPTLRPLARVSPQRACARI
jgi:CRP/FNR family transcriptional regulator, nitrogen fixation regulation protein